MSNTDVAGTRVLLTGTVGGTFAEYVLLPAATAIKVPDAVAVHNAAQFVVNPLTALLMTTRFLKPKKGEYIVQTAAASVLGKLVCILQNIQQLSYEYHIDDAFQMLLHYK